MKNLSRYLEARDWLESYIPLVYGKEELGLARIEELLKRLGNPQNKFKSIHVGGTSGKGSTAFYISRLLRLSVNGSRKEKVGLHISPHLNFIGERMQINGEPIPVEKLIKLIDLIKPAVEAIQTEKSELTPSYFEILVALSFKYFADEKVDWAVVEVGLGGRLDATNVLLPKVSVITNIGMDHTEILGKTIEAIAYEKAGIIKAGVPVVIGAQGKAFAVIKKVAGNKKAALFGPDFQYTGNFSQNHCTKETFLLAIKAVELAGFKVNKQAISDAFSIGFPGRFEEVAPGVLLDGAHNPDKIRALIEFIMDTYLGATLQGKTQGRTSKITLILAFKTGKRWRKMVDLLVAELPLNKVIAAKFNAVTDTGESLAVDPEEIAEYIKSTSGLQTWVCSNSQEAVVQAIKESKNQQFEDLVIVTGSLYLVGEVRTIWKLPKA